MLLTRFMLWLMGYTCFDSREPCQRCGGSSWYACDEWRYERDDTHEVYEREELCMLCSARVDRELRFIPRG